MKKLPDLDLLRSLFIYKGGKLYWLSSGSGRKTGVPAGWIDERSKKNKSTSYIKIEINGSVFYAHRLIWKIVYGCDPDGEIDHIDGNGLNSKIENLRDVSQSVNQRNAKLRINNTSGKMGVSFNKKSGKWVARGSAPRNKTRPFLGYFLLLDDAIKAREDWEKEQGDFTDRGND